MSITDKAGLMISPLFLLKRSFCPPSKLLRMFSTPKSMARKVWTVNVQIIPARRCFGTGTLREATLFSFWCMSTAPAERNMKRTSQPLSSRVPCPRPPRPPQRSWSTPCASWSYKKTTPASIPACLKLRILFLLDITLCLEVWAVLSFSVLVLYSIFFSCQNLGFPL